MAAPLLRRYVDNYINLTPFIGTKETRVKALQETARIKRELPQSGLLYHLLEGPSTRIIFLGWGIDTEKWIIFITDERKKFMIEFLGEWEQKASFSLKDISSLVGLLIFLSQVINGLKVTIDVLILKRTEMARSSSLFATVSKRMRWAITHILYVLNRWKGTSRIYDLSWANKQADVKVFCDIALRDPKRGSFGKGAFTLPSKRWFPLNGRKMNSKVLCARKSIHQLILSYSIC